MTSYVERLARRSREVGSYVCVGLDPAGDTPVAEIADRNRRLIEATAPYAACYKPNLAFYEQFGIPGLRALEETLKAIPDGIPVIADAKRGDMADTAAAYARALFEVWGFDAATVNPFQGQDAVQPFLDYRGPGRLPALPHLQSRLRHHPERPARRWRTALRAPRRRDAVVERERRPRRRRDRARRPRPRA